MHAPTSELQSTSISSRSRPDQLNLILLSGAPNSSAGDKRWATKRLFYRALSAATLGDAERLIDAAAEEGVILNQGAQEIANNSQFLPLVSALAARDEGWDAAFIRQRGERLANLVWSSLAPWLGLD